MRPLNRNLSPGNEYTAAMIELIRASSGISCRNKGIVDVVLNAIKYQQCYYPRGDNGKIQPLRYSKSQNGNKSIKSAIDGMIDAGYLIGKIGHHDLSTRKGLQSTFTITDKFRSGIDFSRVNISESPQEQIRLSIKTKKGEDSVLVDYDDTEQTSLWREQVSAINKHNSKYQVQLHGDILDIECYRVFNREKGTDDFTRGGRFYYHALNVPKFNRKDITIDGEQVAIADFKALHPNMAYSLNGIQYQGADPYTLDFTTTPLQRSINKLLVLCGMNANSRKNAIEAVRIKIKNNIKKGAISEDAASIKLSSLYDAFLAHHHEIKNWFNSASGTYFHYLDSQMMNEALLRCVEQNIPCIPIHDAIMTQESHIDEVASIMKSVYYDTFFKDIQVDIERAKRSRREEREEKPSSLELRSSNN